MVLATARRRKFLWESSEPSKGNRHKKPPVNSSAHAQYGLAEAQVTDAMTAMIDAFVIVQQY